MSRSNPDSEEIRKLADHVIDDAISMIPDFSSVLDSPIVDREVLGVQRESDFYLGMAWASITENFTFGFVDRYHRPNTMEESAVLIKRLLSRLPEIKKAISELGI